MPGAPSWASVRWIAQFQLLNRTSILLLAIVPAIAAVWPVVPYAVASYNGSLSQAEFVLERLRAVVDDSVPVGRAGVLTQQIDSVVGSSKWRHDAAKVVASQVAFLEHIRTQAEGHLPLTFALLFFAALAALAGRTIFDLAAPDIVKRWSSEAYAMARKAEFVHSPTESAIVGALQDLLNDQDSARQRGEEERFLDARSRELASLHSAVDEAEAVRVARLKQADESGLREPLATASELVSVWQARLSRALQDDGGASGPVLRRRIGLIERAAVLQYQREDRKRCLGAWLALACYALAAGLITVAVYRQAREVAIATGWVQVEAGVGSEDAPP